MKKSHNRSRFCRLKGKKKKKEKQIDRISKPICEKKKTFFFIPYHRRNSLEAQELEQIKEITVDQFQVPYD